MNLIYSDLHFNFSISSSCFMDSNRLSKYMFSCLWSWKSHIIHKSFSWQTNITRIPLKMLNQSKITYTKDSSGLPWYKKKKKFVLIHNLPFVAFQLFHQHSACPFPIYYGIPLPERAKDTRKVVINYNSCYIIQMHKLQDSAPFINSQKSKWKGVKTDDWLGHSYQKSETSHRIPFQNLCFRNSRLTFLKLHSPNDFFNPKNMITDTKALLFFSFFLIFFFSHFLFFPFFMLNYFVVN